MSVLIKYVEAFNVAYPQKKCVVEFSHKRNGEEHYAVIIDGDRGSMTLTQSDLREATLGFMAGH